MLAGRLDVGHFESERVQPRPSAVDKLGDSRTFLAGDELDADRAGPVGDVHVLGVDWGTEGEPEHLFELFDAVVHVGGGDEHPVDAENLHTHGVDRTRHKRAGSLAGTASVLVYAVYRRNWRLLVAALAWAALNPFLFPPPDTEEAWMTRAVLAERWWIREKDNRTLGLDYLNVCNTGGATAFICALYAAWRQQPAGTTLATPATVVLKLWWLRVLVQHYDTRTSL